MDIENTQAAGEATTSEQTQSEATKEYSAVEQKAMEMGWRPLEEFSGDEADFIDAKEFVARKPLYDKIGQQSKQLKNVTQAIEALKSHYGKVQETEYKRALKELKAERNRALTEGDADRFEQLDDDIKAKEKEVDQLLAEQNIPIVKEEPTIHPEFANWQNRNPWYSSVKYMREFADELGGKLANTMSPRDVLIEVEKQVRKEFPHKFSNPNKGDAPEVGSSRNTGRGSKGDDITLSDQETKIMNTLVRQGVLTKEQYIKDLKTAKGIK